MRLFISSDTKQNASHEKERSSASHSFDFFLLLRILKHVLLLDLYLKKILPFDKVIRRKSFTRQITLRRRGLIESQIILTFTKAVNNTVEIDRIYLKRNDLLILIIEMSSLAAVEITGIVVISVVIVVCSIIALVSNSFIYINHSI